MRMYRAFEETEKQAGNGMFVCSTSGQLQGRVSRQKQKKTAILMDFVGGGGYYIAILFTVSGGNDDGTTGKRTIMSC
jgi:hypothetical protein